MGSNTPVIQLYGEYFINHYKDTYQDLMESANHLDPSSHHVISFFQGTFWELGSSGGFTEAKSVGWIRRFSKKRGRRFGVLDLFRAALSILTPQNWSF